MKNRQILLTTVLSALVCVRLCPQVRSATDAPTDDVVPPTNTADGQLALASITAGIYNTAFGFYAALSISDASLDTAVGAGALLLDTAGTNTAVGAGALLSNSTGSANNAVGTFALFNNIEGEFNNAHGRNCLLNSTGSQNNAWAMTPCFQHDRVL